VLRFLTAGESHGPGLTALIEGLPRGLRLDIDYVNDRLARRQRGYGRGGRMKIEQDRVEVTAGLRGGITLGSPLALHLVNRDHASWRARMDPLAAPQGPPVTLPRPGHADLAGALKYGADDVRDVLERASARETAARTAVGAVAALLLREFGIRVLGYVVAVGSEEVKRVVGSPDQVASRVEASEMRCPSPRAAERMRSAIREASRGRDTLGGWVEVTATGVPPGLGSHVHWDRKLDGRLAGALVSIQSAKAVEFGDGFAGARRPGSALHDPILPGPSREGWPYRRGSNRAGGIEGGTSNGEPIRMRVAFKPISTLKKPLPSVDIGTGRPGRAHVERSDICVLPAASVVAEAVTAWVLAEAFLDKFPGDTVEEIRSAYRRFERRLGRRKGRPSGRKRR
jgi:chorismate synthase